jgi:hypothetical protein
MGGPISGGQVTTTQAVAPSQPTVGETTAIRAAIKDYFAQAGVVVAYDCNVAPLRGSWAGAVLSVPGLETGYCVLGKTGGEWTIVFEPANWLWATSDEMIEELVYSGGPRDFATQFATCYQD